MKNKRELLSQLNGLLERNHDAVNGYKDAARDVQNKELREYLLAHAKERLRFGKVINNEILALGGTPVKTGSTLGLLHRSWMNFKTNLVHDNEDEVCEECIRGEYVAIEEYDDLLKIAEIPEELKKGLLAHKEKTLQAIASLTLIKDTFKN